MLLVAAIGSAIAGLAATIATSEPLALNLCGSWRPSGPFEYPPALALVCAGALPVALGVATERRRALVVGGALAGWLLITAVALTANRTGIGLSALAATGCVALAPRRRPVGPVALATIGAAAASALILHGDLAPRRRRCARAGAAARRPRRGRRAVGRWRVAARVGAGDAGRRSSASPRSWRRPSSCSATAARPAARIRSHGRVGIWRAALHTAAERPLQGFGAGTFLAATRERQLRERPVPTRFAHDLALQEWVELGIGGLLAVVAWYLAVGWTLARELWPGRVNGAAWLLAPAVAAFPPGRTCSTGLGPSPGPACCGRWPSAACWPGAGRA